MHIVFRKNPLDRLDTAMDSILIVGSTILTQKVFQDEGGNYGITFDFLDQILSDHQSGKTLVYLLIKIVHLFSSVSRNQSPSAVAADRYDLHRASTCSCSQSELPTAAQLVGFS